MAHTSQLALALLTTTIGLALASCVEGPTDKSPVVPPPATLPKKDVDNRPTITPIKLEKPRMLGPLTPAIVTLPDRYAEPLIRVRLRAESPTIPAVKKSAYRGKVETVQLANGKYLVINTLPLDAYLQGVLPKELYGSWDEETYKAQAVAARTYAVYQINTDTGGKPWDVTNDESSQMYGGIAGETAKSREAVAETRGQLMLGKVGDKTGVFCAFYSACSGGATQDPFEAWGDYPVGTLSARRTGNIDANCPKFNWPSMTMSKIDLSRCIRNWGERNGFAYLTNLGPIKKVTISKRNPATNRPTEFLLMDTVGKTVPIRAEEFRLALIYDPAGSAPKPLSSWFDILDGGPTITFANGRGYGHGIGMSQWGAQAMAADGKNYRQILNFYYPGSTIKKYW